MPIYEFGRVKMAKLTVVNIFTIYISLMVIYLVNIKESMEVENREGYSIVGDECKKILCTRYIKHL